MSFFSMSLNYKNVLAGIGAGAVSVILILSLLVGIFSGASNSATETACGFLEEYTGFSNPGQVAVDRNKNIYVANTGENNVIIIDKDGNRKVVGKKGSGPGEFNEPRSIALGGSIVGGDFFVADFGNNRIQRFSSDGDFVKEYNSAGYGGVYIKPIKLVFYELRDNPNTSFDTPYIGIANDNQTILELNLQTDKINFFTKHAITLPIKGIDTSYEAYTNEFMFVSVSNGTSENKVLKFDLFTGDFVADWGETGSKVDQFGVAGDLTVWGWQSNQKIYVLDTIKNLIHVFDFDGKFESNFLGLYDGENKYLGLSSLYRGADGFLYATTKDGKIRKFGTDCAILKIHKDFLPDTHPTDFDFKITQKAPAGAHFSSGIFKLDDDPADTKLDSVAAFYVPKGLGAPKEPEFPWFPAPAPDPATINIFEIEELDNNPEMNISWQCDYGFAKIPENGPALGNKGFVNVVWSSIETNCYFYNDNYAGAKIIIIKKVKSDIIDKTEFKFNLKSSKIDENFSLDDYSSVEDPYDPKTNLFSNTKEIKVKEDETYILSEDFPVNKAYKVTYGCSYVSSRNGSVIDYDFGVGQSVELKPKSRQTVICTFTNEPNPAKGKLIIKKDAIPNNPDDKFFFIVQGGQKKIFDEWGGHPYAFDTFFELKDDGSGGNVRVLDAIDQSFTYRFSEHFKGANYVLPEVTCLDSNFKKVNINIVIQKEGSLHFELKFPDENKAEVITCTFINKKKVSNEDPSSNEGLEEATPDVLDFRLEP